MLSRHRDIIAKRGLLALFAVIAVACVSEPLEFADWTIPVPEGTRIIEYPAVPIEERVEHIELVEDLVIGGESSDPDSLLHPRGYTDGAIALSSDEVFVLDAGNSRVQAFDRNNGSYLFTIGSAGQGPGEFQRPSRIAINASRLVVTDPRAPKLSFWSLSGEHIVDATTQVVRVSRSIAGLSDGSMVISFLERQEEEPVIVLARIDDEGSEMRRYLEAPAAKTDILQVSGRTLALTHAGPEATFAVGSADRVYVTSASEYQIAALDAGGNLGWALRVAWEATPYPQTAIDQQISNLQERYPAVRADMFNWPERLPVLSIILVDGHDHVYVFPYVRRSYLEEHEQRPVDVYSPDGDHLFSGFIKTRWEAAAGDFVYVYEEQEDSGEWAVVRYRLVEPF